MRIHRFRFLQILAAGVLAASASIAGEYQAAPAGPPPSEVPGAFSALLEKDGTRIVDAKGGVVSEIWLAATAPHGPKSDETNVTLADIPHGSLMGVIRFPAAGKDRRGQAVKPGIYTLRYSMFPIDGAHQGVAPQRDFWLLTRMADDTDPKALPNYDALVDWSRKASGMPHPLVISIWKADDPKADFYSAGESDWVLQRKMGDVWLAIVVIGTAAA
jgi:hypothetical protein